MGQDLDNGFRPAGLIDLSSTTVDGGRRFSRTTAATYATGTATHSLTLYRAPSGALVFGAGTVQWSWGLDDDHTSPAARRTDRPRMQQATVNLFADMGVAAGDAADGSHAGDRVDRHDRADVDDHRAGQRRQRPESAPR